MRPKSELSYRSGHRIYIDFSSCTPTRTVSIRMRERRAFPEVLVA
jgi:hypothetical protein